MNPGNSLKVNINIQFNNFLMISQRQRFRSLSTIYFVLCICRQNLLVMLTKTTGDHRGRLGGDSSTRRLLSGKVTHKPEYVNSSACFRRIISPTDHADVKFFSLCRHGQTDRQREHTPTDTQTDYITLPSKASVNTLNISHTTGVETWEISSLEWSIRTYYNASRREFLRGLKTLRPLTR